jgi:hypothetical protein
MSPGRYTAHLKNTDAELSMWKKKQRLRSIYKQWKCGLLDWSMISKEDQELLIRYYGAGE